MNWKLGQKTSSVITRKLIRILFLNQTRASHVLRNQKTFKDASKSKLTPSHHQTTLMIVIVPQKKINETPANIITPFIILNPPKKKRAAKLMTIIKRKPNQPKEKWAPWLANNTAKDEGLSIFPTKQKKNWKNFRIYGLIDDRIHKKFVLILALAFLSSQSTHTNPTAPIPVHELAVFSGQQQEQQKYHPHTIFFCRGKSWKLYFLSILTIKFHVQNGFLSTL